MVTAVRTLPAISNAGLLFLKVSVLVCMVIGHADWLLFDKALGFHATIGRTVAPAFAVVLALNLHRLRAGRGGVLLWRLAFFGVLSQVPYAYLQGDVLPLNILFALLVSVSVVLLSDRGRWFDALLVALVGGAAVDYAWFGVAALWGAHWLLGRGVSIWGAGAWAAFAFACWNGTLWSFGVLAWLGLASLLKGDAPRWRWLFYVGYPLHLGLLAGARYAGWV